MMHFKDLPEEIQQQFGEQCCNMLSLKKVKINGNVDEWLKENALEYDENTMNFVTNYTNKTVYVYEYDGEWFVLGDDSTPIGWECFTDVK